MHTVVGVQTGSTRRGSGSECQPPPTILFTSWRQLAGVLSDENRELLHLIRDNQPKTIQELSRLSGRAASNLSRTLHNLERHSLVRLHRSPGTRALRPEALATSFLVVLD